MAAIRCLKVKLSEGMQTQGPIDNKLASLWPQNSFAHETSDEPNPWRVRIRHPLLPTT
jgi:hypothetical protein